MCVSRAASILVCVYQSFTSGRVQKQAPVHELCVQVGHSGEVRCACAGCARWQTFVRGQQRGGPAWPQYEVFTAEFVDALAAYLRSVAQRLLAG